MAYDIKELHNHFFSDPMWPQVEEMLLEYLEPFRSVMNIPSNLSNDEIASEIRGRQLMIANLEKFLTDTEIIRSRLNKGLNNFK